MSKRDWSKVGQVCDYCGNGTPGDLITMGNPGDFDETKYTVAKICKPHHGCQKEYTDEPALYQWGMFFKGTLVADIPFLLLGLACNWFAYFLSGYLPVPMFVIPFRFFVACVSVGFSFATWPNIITWISPIALSWMAYQILQGAL